MDRPTDFHLALALSVVRSVPRTSTLLEHLNLLRLRLDAGATSTASHKLGHSEASLERELRALQDHCMYLEEENRSFRVKLLDEQPPGRPPSRAAKRKTNVQDRTNTASERAIKRGRLQIVSEQSDSFFDASELLELGQTRQDKYMRLIYSLHVTCRQKDPVSSDIARLISQAASEARNMITSQFGSPPPVTHSELRSSHDGRDQLEATNTSDSARALARSFRLLLQGLTVLDEALNGDKYRSNTVHHLVSIFSATLSLILRVPNAQTVGHFPARGERESTTTKSRSARPSSKQKISGNTEPLDALVHLAAALLRLPKPTLPSHNLVFQGMLYHLLDYAGRMLHTFTFSESAINVSVDTTGPDHQHYADAAATAPYLVAVFDIAMRLAPSHTRAGNASQPFSHTARMRLQRTLLRSVFATDSPVSDTFQDCLLPNVLDQSLDDVLNKTAVKTGKRNRAKGMHDSGESFIAEIWGLVGWDVLGREGDLAAMAAEKSDSVK